MASPVGFGAFGTAIFALICDIVALSLDYWVSYDDHITVGIKIHSGLWKYCNGEICTNMQVVSTELAAVRAMVLLALFLDVGAVVCGGLKLFLLKDKGILNKVACGLLSVAGLFLMIGFAVFAADNSTGLHAGFAFCIIAWIAAWVAAGLFGVMVKSDE